MKALLFAIIPFIFYLSDHSEKREPNVTVILHLDEELSQTEQKIYITSFCPMVSGFEQNIWDSIQTEKGQKVVELHAYSPLENLFKVMFSKEGPDNLKIYALPKDTVEFEVKHTDVSKNIVLKSALKGKVHNEWVEFSKIGREFWMRKRILESEKNVDSIKQWDNKMIDFYRKEINHTKRFRIANVSMTILRTFFVNQLPADTILAIREKIARTFPSDPRASLSYGYNKKQTENGIHVAKRIKEIQVAKINYNRAKQNTRIGERLNLNLCGIDGNQIALCDLSDCSYIYVDLWASWCAPCRKQFLHIKKALDKYPKALKVYAISIDKNHKSWRKAIEKDSLQGFVHVIGTDNNWNLLKEVSDLGVERIPKSFLLDNKCKIIAKDLHDGLLIEALDSLLYK